MLNIQETPRTFKDVKVGENFLMSDGKYTKQSSRTAVSWRSGGKIYVTSSQKIRQVKHAWGWGV